MWWKWFPWKFILKKVARAQGFIDPITLLSKFNQFAQPSEVWAPVELMRAGAVFHARGLINSAVIQHNLDWVWPYWAERQFDPLDRSFIPRAFSITHINLTHRNWTAVGIPGIFDLPIVDARGLLMPFFDSWSIDAWVILNNNVQLIPSRLPNGEQKLLTDSNIQVISSFSEKNISLQSTIEMQLNNGIPYCQLKLNAKVPSKGLLVISLRPYNPEGVSFVHQIQSLQSEKGWLVNNKHFVFFDKLPAFTRFSDYKHGDVFHWIHSTAPVYQKNVNCEVGLATAIAAFECSSKDPAAVKVNIPLTENKKHNLNPNITANELWKENLIGSAQCNLNYKRFGELFNIALYSTIIHTPKESYAGPYTYRRFWFRDAAFIISALLCAELPKRALHIVETFFERQTSDGYFLSQEGEWDSNGQALWSINRYMKMANDSDHIEWYEPVSKACQWIIKKRKIQSDKPLVNGLLPPGFSAEHLGPNDYYYWDNFWCIAGLKAAVEMMTTWNRTSLIHIIEKEIDDWLKSIDQSLSHAAGPLRRPIMPASPFRRPDSGSVGSLAVGYPLQIWSPTDERLLLTADYLFQNCCIDNAFYHNISHSGINPYLTLHIAEVFLRASDQKFLDLAESIASLASPTGQWPEAIHPQLKSGCMGDGQHIWAAAEWIIFVRNCFVREENNSLILCQGFCEKVITSVKEAHFGYTLTKFGSVKVSLKLLKDSIHVEWDGKWFTGEPQIIINIPGTQSIIAEKNQTQCDIPYKKVTE